MPIKKKTTRRKTAKRAIVRKQVPKRKASVRKKTVKRAVSMRVSRGVNKATRHFQNVALLVWGFIFFLGFLMTQVMFTSPLPSYLSLFMWVVFAGIGYWTEKKLGISRVITKKEVKVWGVGIASGLIVTLAVLYGYLVLHPAFIGLSWLVLMGAGALIGGKVASRKDEVSLGIIWLLTGLLLFFIPSLFPVQFIVLGIGFGVPMIMMGILRDVDFI